MQRLENRSEVTYSELERCLPREVFAVIEDDWREIIRASKGEDFACAFEKALLARFPGVYRLIESAEYLYELPFHVAASHIFFAAQEQEHDSEIDDEVLFSLATRLRELRIANEVPRPVAAPALIPQPQKTGRVPLDKPLRICAICGAFVPHDQVPAHLRTKHSNWFRVSEEQRQHHREISVYRRAHIPTRAPAPTRSVAGPTMTSEIEVPLAVRSASGCCIFCGHRSMPGEHTCYACSPD
jgi:hypothetical protein